MALTFTDISSFPNRLERMIHKEWTILVEKHVTNEAEKLGIPTEDCVVIQPRDPFSIKRNEVEEQYICYYKMPIVAKKSDLPFTTLIHTTHRRGLSDEVMIHYGSINKKPESKPETKLLRSQKDIWDKKEWL